MVPARMSVRLKSPLRKSSKVRAALNERLLRLNFTPQLYTVHPTVAGELVSFESSNLKAWLAQFLKKHRNASGFPEQGVDYFTRFEDIDRFLNERIHPHVNQGASVHSSALSSGPPNPVTVEGAPEDAPVNDRPSAASTAAADEPLEPVWLTDHGPKHISTVIQRASDLTRAREPFLTPYEAYLLLVAIHFHDVGNIFGREGHEKRITSVMSQIEPSVIGENALEKRMIRDIAMAHGGKILVGGHETKDTIGQLRYEITSALKAPRVQLLAAILRLADELADDSTRTERFLLNNALIAPESEIFHMYADRLRGVQVSGEEHRVALHFDIAAKLTQAKYQRLDQQVYLFDEIQLRTLKMHREHVYCSRFWRPWVHIARIDVQIQICSDDYMNVIDTISYSMSEHGYPDSPNALAQVCPELSGLDGVALEQRVKFMTVRGGGD
jgi:hypothetical protein